MSREEAKRRAELYQALADGKTLQYYFSTRDKWEDVEGDEFDVIQKVHGFMRFRGMLRIKPEPKKARLKVALNKTNENKYYLCTVSDDDDVGKNLLANSKSFVKWLDHLEYELPEGDE